MKTILTTTLLAGLLCASSAPARIGEDVAQIETRYGKPVKPGDVVAPATVAHEYFKNGITIIVQFHDGRAQCETFARGQHEALTPAEIETLLAANAAGKIWSKVRDRGSDKFWKLDGGDLLADYDAFNERLTVINAQFQEKSNALKAEKEKKNLGGF